jgi:thiamine-phosphate pyrophosphorylase
MASIEALNFQTFRLVDASINRIAEGLRYLEDVARFLLNDSALTQQLKVLRHNLVISELSFQKQLLSSRDAVEDIGLGIVVKQEDERRDLITSIIANSRRVQEALRTLEELSKINRFSKRLTPQKFEQARFNVYTIEKELAARLARLYKLLRIRGIYVVFDMQALNGRDHLEIAQQVIKGGARVIQLRDKVLDHGKLFQIAQDIKRLCSQNNILFIVNDYLDIALAVQADGLHLGQTDLPVSVARKYSPIDLIIGCSADTVTRAKKAVADGADYIAVGAVFPTTSKDIKVVGLKAFKTIKQAVSVPVVAIGGINKENVKETKNAGADAACVISAVMDTSTPEKAIRELIKEFEGDND